MAYLYASTGSYHSLFIWGCAALSMGMVLIVFSKQKAASTTV